MCWIVRLSRAVSTAQFTATGAAPATAVSVIAPAIVGPMPKVPAVRTACAARAAATRALEGTQPVHVQSPPSLAFSTSVTAWR
jgi:hypothetical protein